MIPISNVTWGPTDALDSDLLFSKKWTEPTSVKNCLQQDKWIITGEKGSGKSAIRRALNEVYGNQYIAIPVVDFNDIAFKAIYDNLVEFANMTKLSKTTTLSHYWQYAMLVELIQAASNVKAQYNNILCRLPKYKKDEGHIFERLSKLLERAWNKIDEVTCCPQSDTKSKKNRPANLLASGGLTAKLLNDLKNFPLDTNVTGVKRDFFSQLNENGDKIVLVLDGFDRLRNEGAPIDAIRLIFDSLIDAVRVIRSDQYLPRGLEIKAFIPHDRYIAITLRDSDKIDTMHASIRWRRQELQEFLKNRLKLTPGLPDNAQFDYLWRQIMPEKIKNKHYGLDEESFDYILRHTMMRPRQLQHHLEQLQAENPGRIVDPSGVPNAISESSKKIGNFFIQEFQAEHPNLSKFIGSLHGSDNVIEFKAFRCIIKKAIDRFHRKSEKLTIESKIDRLYTMGIFGVVNFIEPNARLGDIYYPPTNESKRHYVDFFYKNPHPSISTTLHDESVIAFHSIFIDYASLKPHPSLIIG